MTRPRRSLVSVEDTPWYHVTSRCVRQAFLCGHDPYSGRCFDHRRQWIVDRVAELAAVFAIDVAAYAVLSNHYHLVLRIDIDRSRTWTDDEVVERWQRLFSLPLCVERRNSGEASAAEDRAARVLIQTWRERLADLSWFLRCLNEPIARRANREDRCSGRFWEARFKSQALLDQTAVLTAMAYVDLNPVRAGLAATPEQSAHTSIRQRLVDAPGPDLVPFLGDAPVRCGNPLPFALADYLQLVDASGRVLRNDQHGFIANHHPPILDRLGIRASAWMIAMRHYESRFPTAAGTIDRIRHHAGRIGQHWIQGLSFARRLYLSPA